MADSLIIPIRLGKCGCVNSELFADTLHDFRFTIVLTSDSAPYCYSLNFCIYELYIPENRQLTAIKDENAHIFFDGHQDKEDTSLYKIILTRVWREKSYDWFSGLRIGGDNTRDCNIWHQPRPLNKETILSHITNFFRNRTPKELFDWFHPLAITDEEQEIIETIFQPLLAI